MTETQLAVPDVPATTAERTRTYSWEDPRVDPRALAGMTGQDMFAAMSDGRLPRPPIMYTMDMNAVEVVREGEVHVTLTPQEFHYNPLGTVHGGYGATLLDSAMGCAVHSTLNPGDIYTTLEFKINFVRALTHDTGPVRGIGTVINETRTTALAEGRIEDGEGKLYAFATTTCVIRRATS